MTFIETNTTHHAVCLGGRALFFQVLMGPRERKSLSKVTQQVCGRASLSASRAYTFPWATFKEHSSDHRIQKKPIWALRPPWKPPPPRPPGKVAAQTLPLDCWRSRGDSSALMGPRVPNGRGQETQRRQVGSANRSSIYF